MKKITVCDSVTIFSSVLASISLLCRCGLIREGWNVHGNVYVYLNVVVMVPSDYTEASLSLSLALSWVPWVGGLMRGN